MIPPGPDALVASEGKKTLWITEFLNMFHVILVMIVTGWGNIPRHTPLKTNMSTENQWLEDVFPTEIVSS